MGWTDITTEKRKDILLEAGAEVRRMVREACARAVMRKRTVETEDYDEFTYSDQSDDDEEAETTGVYSVYSVRQEPREGYEFAMAELQLTEADFMAAISVIGLLY